jgi:hypothetical protein
MVEAGIWMVQTELASHAIFQIVYQLLSPYGWDGLKVINLVSCLAGALSIWVLLKFNRDFIPADPLWALGLFASSGLALFCNGHTEYYTLFLITLFYYGYAGVGYLRGRFSMLHVSLAFSAGVWMHLGILFALPSLFLLLWLKRSWSDASPLLTGLSFVVLAYVIKTFHTLLGFHVQGLSPSDNFIPLFSDPGGGRFYTMFTWGHLADMVYAWTMRSWIFWPAIVWAAGREGWRSLLQPERLFLLAYTLCFTLFTLTWHPNLGIHQDWDLFAIEAAPCLLLLLTYLPSFLDDRFRRYALAIPILASMLIMFSSIRQEAHFERRGYGSVAFEFTQAINCNVTFNGHKKEESPLFDRKDLIDFPALVVQLQNRQDPVSEFLRTRLSAKTNRMVDEEGEKDPVSDSLQKSLIRDLNRILAGPAIYDAQRFDRIAIPPDIRKMTDQDSTKKEQIMLNRLLLETAYPSVFVESRKHVLIRAIREGVYSLKIIDTTNFRVHDLFVNIVPQLTTQIPLLIEEKEQQVHSP